MRLPLLLSVALAALTPALPVLAQAAPATTAAANTPAAQLRALFNASDEASLARNPLSGIFRGDMRRADEFGDYLSDAYLAVGEKGRRGRSEGARRHRPQSSSMPMTRSATTSSNGSAPPI